ncbi:rCG20436 [Rattus norvegicus]|uniref:RCG20436 n=1 Tax=Rattus norvegicus TaxID=10116 RepID=A6JG57_RAT|nr:rCG20436 [Rattus norvegicus]
MLQVNQSKTRDCDRYMSTTDFRAAPGSCDESHPIFRTSREQLGDSGVSDEAEPLEVVMSHIGFGPGHFVTA